MEYAWQVSLRAAQSETDLKKIQEKVIETESAIFLRTQELRASNDSRAERTAMEAALTELLRIKREKLKWPPVTPLPSSGA
jgi:hypothetical protein